MSRQLLIMDDNSERDMCKKLLAQILMLYEIIPDQNTITKPRENTEEIINPNVSFTLCSNKSFTISFKSGPNFPYSERNGL